MAVEWLDWYAVAKYAFLFCIFIVAWGVMTHTRLRYIITAVGLVQAFIVLGQFSGLIQSRHILFDVTGFMGNPGQMGGFQAVASVCCLSLIKEYRHGQKVWLMAVFALLSLSLAVSDSRAAWIAMLAGTAFVYRKEIQGAFKKRKSLIPVSVAVLAVFAVGLYLYRSGSADARLLIWRVSLDMIADRPLTGFGPGNFPRYYMLYQADWFRAHPDSEFAAVADNAVYSFNEYIKLAVEAGLPGLLLFVAALCLLWHYTKDRDSFASLTTLLVFGFFSYPSDKLLPASLMPLITGTVLHDRFGALSGNAGVRFSAMAATAVMAMAIYVFSGMGHPEKHYAGIPDCETWCDLGQASEAAGEPGQAEEYYRTASYMIPTRLRPNYLLWKLYLDAGRNDDATRTAWKILSMPLKVENTYTLRVKDEVREWLAGRTGD